MLDLPARPPDVVTCDVCGGPAVLARRAPGRLDEAVCVRHRAFLSPAPQDRAGVEHLELRWGRWCGGQASVAEVLASARPLPCEACGAAGEVIWGVENEGGRWHAVLCLDCLEPAPATAGPSQISSRGLGRWDGARWLPVDAGWRPPRRPAAVPPG
ncbi:MAG: hypothetical protein HY830_18125 [Actinobacteria bacterium]|nr:hypothetical protein [Actinomycetota bacterium]